MCGICGHVSLEPDSGSVALPVVRRMMECMQHRGPDDSGVWSDSHAALGHNRLAIIDLSQDGHQPMISHDGQKVVVFNGEIYNYRELRNRFSSEMQFRFQNDTEVILNLYERFGPGCLKYLRGMFAFAIWDSAGKQLFLARDRVGKKPLFYSIQNGRLAFASELRALRYCADFEFEINDEALYHYLTLQYIPAPLTIYRNVYKLPHGHCAIFKHGELKTEHYWALQYKPQPWQEQQAMERLDEIFTEAVRLRMIADVPIGAFLSGGMDSSSVVAVMSRLSSSPVRSFSISFEEDEFNEVPFARQVAERYGTEHQEFSVRARNVDILSRLAWHYSEPYADSSAIPTFYLSQMTRQKVKVALNGDGGDELFGGYNRYLLPPPSRLQRMYSLLSPIARKIPPNMRYVWRIRRFIDDRSLDLPRLYMQKMSYFSEDEKRRLFNSEFFQKVNFCSTLGWYEEKFSRLSDVPFPQNLMAVDIETYLPDDLLVKVDVASMACSLEARSPFLDHELMEFAATLPAHLKIRNGTTKYLLKQYMKDKLPKPIIHRAKMGFGVPLTLWFRSELVGFLHDLLLSRASLERGYFQKRELENLIRQHTSGLFDNGYKLYSLVMLELWHRTHVDHIPVPNYAQHAVQETLT